MAAGKIDRGWQTSDTKKPGAAMVHIRRPGPFAVNCSDYILAASLEAAEASPAADEASVAAAEASAAAPMASAAALEASATGASSAFLPQAESESEAAVRAANRTIFFIW